MNKHTAAWDNARHALGVNDMDATHREFVAQVAALIAADNTAFPTLFQQLLEHTRAHFMAEGKLMRESKYRGLPEHESEHHRVLGELQQLNRSLRRGHLPLVRAYVKEGLMEWFDAHVVMMDAALVMHLKKQANIQGRNNQGALRQYDPNIRSNELRPSTSLLITVCRRSG